MRKTKKKGFTIVELVIVIAIIAILAAVLIPTFSKIIKKANRSSDTQLIRNLNTAVAMDLAEAGLEKHATMYDAVKACEEAGYMTDVIVAKSDYNIAWESTSGHFVLLDMENGKVMFPADKNNIEEYLVTNNDHKAENYFVVAKPSVYNSGENKFEGKYADYSIYAYDDGHWAENITVNKGFDAGEVTTIKTISYVNTGATGQEVVIRTNGGELIVNAPNDTVKHFNAADYVGIASVADHSYYEYGTVSMIEIETGRIVLTSESEVKAIHLDANEAANGYSNIIIGVADGATIPQIVTRDGVTVTEKTLVATIQTVDAEGVAAGTDEKVYVYPSGEQGFANKHSDENKLVDSLVGQLILESAAGENVSTADETYVGNVLFAGGRGTEEDPFLISNRKELENISMSHMTGYVGTYYKVKDGVNEIDCSNWTPIWIEANFDGNGVTLTNLDAPLFSYVGYNYDSPVFRNFNVVANMHYNADRAAIITYNYAKTQVTLESVNVSGIIESSLGASTYFGYGESTINLIDCISTANLVATGGGVSGIVNHPRYGAGAETYINIIDSAFVGSMSYKDGTPGYFGTNYWSATVTVKYSNEFISKYGNPNGTLYNQPAGSADENGVITFTGTSSMQYIATGKSATLTNYSIDLPNVGESFSVAKISGASKIVVTLEIGANDENGHGNYVATYEIEEIDASGYDTGDTITTNKIKNFEIVVVPANNTDKVTGAAGATYYVVSGRNGSTYGSAVVRITQYDSVGNVIGISSVSIKK